ncbi:MAG: 3-hydroxyacyl-ACP dehydratase FabZ, partial [Chromatiaceae bacterium]|nr:3-hydroxyacyl-ACP dehydratase FabZ [Chromatiaceae bacterium]
MDIQQIQSLLPHRYPFLLVDRVIEVEPGKRLVAIKNVTINEPFFQGHFPSKPVMPGVLLIEAMAQATGLLAMESAEVPKEAIYYLVGVDKARFKRPV